MPKMSDDSVTTAERLLEYPAPGRHELVRGELRSMSAAGHWHGAVVILISARLVTHVEGSGLGRVYGAETGFVLARDPDTVRAPDAAFVERERVVPPGLGFFPGPPDLAVEVTSPSESFAAVQEKALSWLEHGTREVWVIDPVARSATIYRGRNDIRCLGEDEVLTSDDVVPGFSIAVRQLFPS